MVEVIVSVCASSAKPTEGHKQQKKMANIRPLDMNLYLPQLSEDFIKI